MLATALQKIGTSKDFRFNPKQLYLRKNYPENGRLDKCFLTFPADF